MGGRGASAGISRPSNRFSMIKSGDKEIDRITKRLLNDKELQKAAFSERTQKRVGIMKHAKEDITRLSKEKHGLLSDVVSKSKAKANYLKSLKNEYKNIGKETAHNEEQRDYWAQKAKEWRKKDPVKITKEVWGEKVTYSARAEDAFFKASSLNNIISRVDERKATLERQIKNFYSNYEEEAKADIKRAYKLINYTKTQNKK